MLCSATDMNSRSIERLSAVSGEVWSVYGLTEAGIWSTLRPVKAKDVSGQIGEPPRQLHRLCTRCLPPAHLGRRRRAIVSGGRGTDGYRAGRIHRGRVRRQALPHRRVGAAAGQRPDRVSRRRDDRFSHRGRLVAPAEIERVLRQHPAVAEAAVVHVKDSSSEGSIGAFIAPRVPTAADAAPLIRELEKALAASLPSDLQPAFIALRDSLPHRQSGAIDRQALEAFKPPANRDGTRPSSDIEARLAAIWKSMLAVESVAVDDNFFEIGGHSLLAARMLTRVEREFGRRIKLATLFLAPTLESFAKVLTQADLREFDFRQVVKIQPHGSKRPLIAINNTGIYYGLAKSLGPEQPVYSLQLFDPSIKDAALPDTVEDIARGYVELIRRVQPEGPYDLMGWCVAGALAFEVARQLRSDGQEIAHLFLIDSWVPGYFRRLPKLHGLIAEYSLRVQLIVADWRRVSTGEQSLRTFITQREIFKKLQRWLGRNADAPLPPETDSLETYDQWLLKYLQRLTARYQPKPYPGNVVLVRSVLEPTGWFFREDAGWGALASSVDVRFAGGDHFTMFQEPGLTEMAAHVAEALEKTGSPALPV